MLMNSCKNDLGYNINRLENIYLFHLFLQVILFINLVFSTLIFGYILHFFHKKTLVILSGILGFTSHLMIYLLPNCINQN